MKYFVIILFVVYSKLSLAALVVPGYCQFSREDLARAPQTSRLGAILQNTRDAAGQSAMNFLTRAYARRTALEQSMIQRNPSYALPYANASLFAPILSGMMCNTPIVQDLQLAGGLNHFLISAFLTAQIGRDDGCKLVMSHEMGDSELSNSYMDMRNNILGNEAGIAHRTEFLACMNLMIHFSTQKIRQENTSNMFDTISALHVFGNENLENSFSDLSPQSLATRFVVANPQLNSIREPEACNNLKKIIKEVYMPRLYYTERSRCDSRMSGTPSNDSWESDRRSFDDYRANMENAIAQ